MKTNETIKEELFNKIINKFTGFVDMDKIDSFLEWADPLIEEAF